MSPDSTVISRRFSRRPVFAAKNPRRQHNADVAQLVEHLICNQGVRGSSPLVGTNKNKGLAGNS